ncbi:double-stranded-RNA-binding protein 4 [Striga asiatica]|uniref:Double-stranded-RNA-binding protein 4 n=1 Tax=Striga asiatica TaxID=4170 RepID=A0A5A7PD60_STRAF|nr:double-stranded-RNA-binding protein 4 [Striga asiatica]
MIDRFCPKERKKLKLSGLSSNHDRVHSRPSFFFLLTTGSLILKLLVSTLNFGDQEQQTNLKELNFREKLIYPNLISKAQIWGFILENFSSFTSLMHLSDNPRSHGCLCRGVLKKQIFVGAEFDYDEEDPKLDLNDATLRLTLGYYH